MVSCPITFVFEPVSGRLARAIKVVTQLSNQVDRGVPLEPLLAKSYGEVEFLRTGLELKRKEVHAVHSAPRTALVGFDRALRRRGVIDLRVLNAILRDNRTRLPDLHLGRAIAGHRLLEPVFRNPHKDLIKFVPGTRPAQIIFFASSRRSAITVELLASVADAGLPMTVLLAPFSLKKPFSRKLYHFARKRLNLLVRPRNVQFLDVIQRAKGMPGDLLEACAEYGAELKLVSNFRSETVRNAVELTENALGVFTGAQILPRETIEDFDGAMLHYHPGRIPSVRGLETIEWPLLMRAPEQVGYSIQFMNAGLDSGAIIASETVPVAETKSLSELRSQVQYDGIQAEVRLLRHIVASGLPTAQVPTYLSPQFFVMAPPLFRHMRHNYTRARKGDL